MHRGLSITGARAVVVMMRDLTKSAAVDAVEDALRRGDDRVDGEQLLRTAWVRLVATLDFCANEAAEDLMPANIRETANAALADRRKAGAQ